MPNFQNIFKIFLALIVYKHCWVSINCLSSGQVSIEWHLTHTQWTLEEYLTDTCWTLHTRWDWWCRSSYTCKDGSILPTLFQNSEKYSDSDHEPFFRPHLWLFYWVKKCGRKYRKTSALILQSHDDRGVCTLIVKGM